jgi:hypothetical protein
MAYNPSKLYQLYSSAAKVTAWLYITTDTFATVSASNYFSDALLRRVKPGDSISVLVFTTTLPDGELSGFSSLTPSVFSAVTSSGGTIAAVTSGNSQYGLSGPNLQNNNYTFALSDMGSGVEHTDSSSAYTWSIPPRSTVAWPTTLMPTIKGFNSRSSGTLTIAPGSGVTLTSGGTSGSVTIAAYSTFVLSMDSADNWILETGSASSGLTINTTTTSGATAGQLLYSDGSKLQAGGAVKTSSLALGGATIGTDALGVTGTVSISSTLTLNGAAALSSPAAGQYQIQFGGTTAVDYAISTAATWTYAFGAGYTSTVDATGFRSTAPTSIGCQIRLTQTGISDWKIVNVGNSADLQISASGVRALACDTAGNVQFGTGAVIATNATNGFAYLPTCAGTPTGTPTVRTGGVPAIYDTTGNKLWVYRGGAWAGVAI